MEQEETVLSLCEDYMIVYTGKRRKINGHTIRTNANCIRVMAINEYIPNIGNKHFSKV